MMRLFFAIILSCACNANAQQDRVLPFYPYIPLACDWAMMKGESHLLVAEPDSEAMKAVLVMRNSPRYVEREQAQKRLLELGPLWNYWALRDSDAEVRFRAQKNLKILSCCSYCSGDYSSCWHCQRAGEFWDLSVFESSR